MKQRTKETNPMLLADLNELVELYTTMEKAQKRLRDIQQHAAGDIYRLPHHQAYYKGRLFTATYDGDFHTLASYPVTKLPQPTNTPTPDCPRIDEKAPS